MSTKSEAPLRIALKQSGHSARSREKAPTKVRSSHANYAALDGALWPLQ